MNKTERNEATVRNMRLYGGSFAHALASAWELADAENRARIEAAFPELWERYAPENWGKRS